MRIVVLPPRGVTFTQESPWNALIEGLRACGHEVNGYGISSLQPDALVTLNDQPGVNSLQQKYSISANRSALIVLEPRVTAPQMYTRSVLGRYGLKFAASPLWADAIDARSFLWPQTIIPSPTHQLRDQFVATMINADKRSAVRGSLYGLRRQIIRMCDSHSVPLAVFGSGWDDSVPVRVAAGVKSIARAIQAGQTPQLVEAIGDPSLVPRNYMGTVQSKSTAFGHARIAVIVENSRDYVSEKLIDAICAGVTPIYVGPPLDLFDIPPDVAIECEPDASLVCQTLQSLNESQQEKFVLAGRDWITGEYSRKHGISAVLTALGHSIGHQLGRR